MSDLYSVDLGVVLDAPAIATGHVAMRRAWEDGPNGRRPGQDAERNEQGHPLYVVDVLLPLGRDGQSVVLGVTVPGGEQAPHVAPLTLLGFEGMRAYIRPPKAGRGVEVSLSAQTFGVVQSAPAPTSGRRAAGGDGAE